MATETSAAASLVEVQKTSLGSSINKKQLPLEPRNSAKVPNHILLNIYVYAIYMRLLCLNRFDRIPQ